jgi:enoyl-CoA hydratase
MLSETFDPQSAVAAGFLDRVVDPEDVSAVALEIATAAAALDARAHAATKRRARSAMLTAIEDGLSEFSPAT